MSTQRPYYIAGSGMITSIGGDVAMTTAAVVAGISGYAVSSFYNRDNQPIVMASVPDAVFSESDIELDEGDLHNERHERVIKLAIIAIREACAELPADQLVPLVLSTVPATGDEDELSPVATNLENHCKSWINVERYHRIFGDRAVGMEAIDFVFQQCDNIAEDFILVGASDSYHDQSRLDPFDRQDRLLTAGNMDAFAPGEAACFLLLTRHRHLAQVKDGHIVALHAPGMADEAGHLESEEPYRGDGLDQAFKKVLAGHEQGHIDRIYSSMNGEHHWAKEYGVAFTRNRAAFADPVEIEHPADLIGDVGCATSTLLIALAAENLYKQTRAGAHLVYSSSDGANRGAIVVEKLAINANELAGVA